MPTSCNYLQIWSSSINTDYSSSINTDYKIYKKFFKSPHSPIPKLFGRELGSTTLFCILKWVPKIFVKSLVLILFILQL